MVNKKLLIAFSEGPYIRNFVTTNAFSELSMRYDIAYLLDDDIKNHGIKNNYFYLHSSGKKSRIMKTLLDYRTFSTRFNNVSALARFNRMYPAFQKTYLYTLIKYKHKRLSKVLSLIFATKNSFIRLIVIFFSSYYIHKFILSPLISYLCTNPQMNRLINEIKPDLILHPSIAHDLFSLSVIEEAKKSNVPVLILIDNWDNLSSKSFFVRKPTYITSWGEQSKEFAVKYQNFESKRVFSIGSAKSQTLFEIKKKYSLSRFNYDYILFVGSAWYFDELGIVSLLDKYVSEIKRNTSSDLKIIYRPHPVGHFVNQLSRLNTFENVILDPFVNLRNKIDHIEKWPELTDYAIMLKHAKFIIGGLTSVIIESQIFNKKYLLLAHEEKYSPSNPKEMFLNYEHFRGIENFKNISICDNLNQLRDFMYLLIKKEAELTESATENHLMYFMNTETSSYSIRLSKIVERILT